MCRFFTSHISAGMTITDVQVLWQQSLFNEYGIRKMCFLNEKAETSESFPSFSAKGVKVGEKVATACYMHGYFEKEHLYHRRMCQMSASSLSADHTFKVSSNIGLWCDGKWIQLYDSLFIVMNEIGVVLSWNLCKGTGFHNVKDQLIDLKGRLDMQRCQISHFYVDNCCQWRHKLNSVFDGVSVKLDPFHAIQRVTSKIPKKRGNSPFERLRAQMVRDFKLILRHPSDIGKQRTKPTPSELVIEKNIQNFLTQWKSVEYEGANLLPQCAIHEIDKLLVHVRKGCLSDIALSGGTSRNEGIHRVLNKTLKKSRIGIQFALALLGIFFYIWNEKRITVVKDKSKIRVTPPIESHFEHLESNQEVTSSNYFRMTSDFEFTPDYGDIREKDSEAAIVDKLNNLLDDSSSSSDEDEPISSECGFTQSSLPNLSEKQRDQVINSSKNMAQICWHIQSLGQCERFNPNILYFCKSSLALLHSGLVGNKESSALDDVLSNYNIVRVSVPPNGNCFFMSVAYAIKNNIIGNEIASSCLASHLESLGLMSCNDTNEICSKLRELTVYEWISHPEEYQPFLKADETLNLEAKLFQIDGHFASELGNSMPLAMANLLKIPIVVMTQMENLPVLPVTPRESLQCLPIFVAFDHSGAGHYDAVDHIANNQPSSVTHPPSSQKHAPSIECCRCGQGARKKEDNISSCDSFRKRCKCFQGVKGCSDKCQCKGCENPHGKRREQTSYSTQMITRKRRPHEVTTENASGKQFLLKRPCPDIVHRWTFIEELVLIQIVQYQLNTDTGIDIGILAMQYSQLVDNNGIHPKTQDQITRRVISFLNDDKVFKTLLKEQARLNWFL